MAKHIDTIPIEVCILTVDHDIKGTVHVSKYTNTNRELTDLLNDREALDNRINLYAIESQPSTEELFAGPDSNYTYVYTPLFMWYENKMEKRVVNNVEKIVEKNEDGTLNYESFVKMMAFPEETPTWDNPFNLTYYSAK